MKISDDFTHISHDCQVKRYTLTIEVSVTFSRDFETEGHIMVYMTVAISACICPTAMILLLFRKVFRSRNSFYYCH